MKKVLILMCILVFLVGCTACAKRPTKQEQNGSSSQTAGTSSGLGQEIVIDEDVWDNPVSSNQQSATSSQVADDTVTSAVTNSGTSSVIGTGTSSTTGTSSGNVIIVDNEKNNINYNDRDKGWSEWK